MTTWRHLSTKQLLMKSYKLSNEGKTFEEKLNKETALNEKLVQKLMKKCVSTPNV